MLSLRSASRHTRLDPFPTPFCILSLAVLYGGEVFLFDPPLLLELPSHLFEPEAVFAPRFPIFLASSANRPPLECIAG